MTTNTNESLTVAEGNQDAPPDLRIFHFNDVYHVDSGSRDPVGGISRFQALHNYYEKDNKFKGQPDLLTFFSGDAFNPSLESSVTKGGHMVPVLNALGTHAACVGNHDLDFGVSQFRRLTGNCTFPWLLANVLEENGSGNLAGSPSTHIVTSSNGIKVGLIGIAEQEWLATVNALPPKLPFISASETVKKLAPQLRADGAEIIIALCHQREVNDRRLAEECPPGMLDIILAGHDHDYRYCKVNGTHIVCSGSDFKQLSYIEVRRRPQGQTGWDFVIRRRDVTKDIPEDPETVALMDKLFSSFREKLSKPIGFTAAPLDARFSTVRKEESNLGNFVADLVKNYYQGDCALVAGGTIRGDQIYPPGVLKLKDIMDCFPFEDPTVMIQCPGQAIWDALENGVYTYPALEGRFCQVSNIKYAFDPSAPKGQRLRSVQIGGADLDPQREYKLVTRHYMVLGGDGFTSLRLKSNGGTATSLVDEESGHLISMLLRQYFMSLKVLGKWKNWSAQLGHHWSGVHADLHETHPVREPIDPRDKDTHERLSQPSTGSSENQGSGVPGVVGQVLRHDAGASQSGEKKSKHDENTPEYNTSAHKKSEEDNSDVRHPGLSDSEDDDTEVPPVAHDSSARERELILIRKVSRRWWQKAGLKGRPSLCDSLDDDGGISWTRGISPRLEGRIQIIGAGA